MRRSWEDLTTPERIERRCKQGSFLAFLLDGWPAIEQKYQDWLSRGSGNFNDDERKPVARLKIVPKEARDKIIEIYIDPDRGPILAQEFADSLGLHLRSDYAFRLCAERGVLPKTRQVAFSDIEVRVMSWLLSEAPNQIGLDESHQGAARSALNKLRVRNEMATNQHGA